MSKRFSEICTKTGDDGTTSLGNGHRVPKDNLRIEVCGYIDELNSTIGLLLTNANIHANIREILLHIQHVLFELGAEICTPDNTIIATEHIKNLEKQLQELNAKLPPLKKFIIPGGNQASAQCHIARTICRKIERRFVTLSRETKTNPFTLQYLNRLADLLFIIARCLNQADSREEAWQH